MTCASVELLEAVRGIAPMRAEPTDGQWMKTPEGRAACGSDAVTPFTIEPACLGYSADCNITECRFVPTTCPACLALLAEARGKERTEALAVRADEIEERGAA